MDTPTDYIAYYRVSTPMQAHEHWEEVQARMEVYDKVVLLCYAEPKKM